MRKLTYFYSLLLMALFLLPWSGVKGAQSLPYSYGFETDFDAEGWTMINQKNNNASYVGVCADASATGEFGYRLSSYNASANQYLISAELNTPNGVVVQFYYKSYYSVETFMVGYSTTTAETGSFTWSDPVLTSGTAWTLSEEYTFPAGTKYVSINYYSNTDKYHLYIDDFEFSVPPTCKKPTAVSGEATAYNQASISWTENNSKSAWKLQYSSDNGTNWTDANGGNNITSNPYTLTGLTASTTYVVRVKTDCGSGDESEWSAKSASFITPCTAATGIGWSENFEEAASGNGVLPDCWKKNSASDNYPQVSASSWYQKEGSTKCLAFDGGTTSSTRIAILPLFNEKTNTLYVTLDYSQAYTNYGYTYDYTGSNYGQLSIGYMTDPFDASSFVAQEALPRVDAYTRASVALTNAPDESYVALCYSGGSSSGYLYVDNISISAIPSCLKPTGVSGSATAYNQASIFWTSSASAWKLQYSADGGTSWTDANSGNNITANPYTLNGLEGNTSYIVRVKADCGSGDESEWSANSEVFTTPCAAIASLTNFDFESSEGTTAGQMPDCWSKLPSSGSYPQVSTSYPKSNSRSLGFYGNTVQYAILPVFSQEVKNLTISFWYRNYYSGVLVVGSMIDPTDASTFKPLATEEVISAYGDAITKVDLKNADDGAYYIAFKHTGSYSYSGSYVDLVSVYPTPSCVEPTGVAGSNMTANSAEISWTNGGSETAWKLQYSTDGSNWTDANSGNNITTKPYILNGLNASTTYYARLKAVCGGSDVSEWSVSSAGFTTACADISSLPWTENFNNKTVDQLPLCWNAEGNTSAVSVKASSSYVTLNSKALYFTGGSGSDVYVLLPEFEADLNTLQIAFSHVEESSSSSGKIEVGYYDTEFHIVKTCDYSESSSAWKTESAVTFPSAANGAKIAFHYKPKTSGYTAAIDDITISLAPTCAIPTDLAAGSILPNSASISWTSSASSFALQYSTDGSNWTSATGTITNPFVLSGLTENTLYYVRVKADCGGGDESEYSDGTFSFRTECDAKTVTELADWTEDFEGQAADAMPTCWKRISGADDVIVVAAGGKTAAKCLQFKGKNPLVAMPEMNAAVKDLKVTLSANCGYNTASYYGQIAVGYVIGSDFTEVDRVSKVESTYETKTIEMPNDVPTTARLAIMTVGGSYSTTIYIDDITVSLKPNCPAPTGLTTVATSTGANVSWTDENASAWKLQYSIKDADSWTEVDNISATNYALTGLSTANIYEVQVKAVCGAGNESAWTGSAEFQPVCAAPTALAVTARTANSASFSWTSTESAWKLQYKADTDADWSEENVTENPFTLSGLDAGTTYQAKIQSACGSAYSNEVEFTTWCAAAALTVADPYVQDFENATVGQLPSCWERISASTYPQVVSGTAAYGADEYTSKKCVSFYGNGTQILVLPAFEPAISDLNISFWYKNSSATLQLGYLAADATIFSEIEALTTRAAYGDEIYEKELTSVPAAAKWIVIKYVGSSEYAHAYVDEFTVRYTPSCKKPTGLAASNETAEGADLAWTEAGSAAAWQIQCKLASVADWDGIAVNDITENPYTLTGLAQGSTYNVRVRANCGDGDENKSDWSEAVEFTTGCAAAALPFVENFESALNGCWDVTDESGSYVHNVYNGSLNLPGGKSGASHLVVLPEITGIGDATMTIRYSCDEGTAYAKPQVGYINGSDEFELLSILAQGNNKDVRVVVGSANGHRLAIKYADGASEGSGMSIDQIRVVETVVFTDPAMPEVSTANQTRLNGLDGKTRDFLLVRPFWCAGYYNTICLPFDLSAEQLAEATCSLNGFTIKAYESADVDLANNTADVYLQTVNVLEAGKAYFAKYDGTSVKDLDTLEFRDVTIDATAPEFTGDATLKIHGLYDPFALTADDQNTLYLSKENKLYYATVAGFIKGFRAYLSVPSGSNLAPAIRRGVSIRISEKKPVATSIEDVQSENGTCTKVLENNQVIIIRNGEKYTIQGQKIQ